MRKEEIKRAKDSERGKGWKMKMKEKGKEEGWVNEGGEESDRSRRGMRKKTEKRRGEDGK